MNDRPVKVIIVNRGTPGLASGAWSCVFALLGLFTIGILFVPFAALFAVIGMVRAATALSFTGLAISIIGAIMTVIAAIHSPSVWIALGVGALGMAAR